MFRWVFLDVGNVLLDEDSLTYAVCRAHFDAIRSIWADRSYEELLGMRERLAMEGSRWPLYELTAAAIGEQECSRLWNRVERDVRGRYASLSPPILGAEALLDFLGGRTRLGLIANQGRECRDLLASLGWLSRFDVVAFSEERNRFKPDLELFRVAIAEAGADPGECLMVGDRMDNDIVPAAALGMATAWIAWPDRAAKRASPPDLEEAAYLHSLERIALARSAEPSNVVPSFVASTLASLQTQIEFDCGRSG